MLICVLQSFVSVSLLSPVDPTPVIKLIKMIGTQTRSLDNKQPFNDSTVQFRIRIRLKILQDGLDCDWKLSRVDAVNACPGPEYSGHTPVPKHQFEEMCLTHVHKCGLKLVSCISK